MSTFAYLRISTSTQDLESQELAIRRHAESKGLTIDHWLRIEISSRKDTRQRRIDELMESLEAGDTLIVTELSRLGRSIGQVINIVDSLISNKVRFISIKEGLDLNGSTDIASKVTITLFSMMAEIERDLISMRTKEALAARKAAGVKLGRPKGTTHSKLDGKEDEIKRLLDLGVSKASAARILGVAYGTLNSFIIRRGIK